MAYLDKCNTDGLLAPRFHLLISLPLKPPTIPNRRRTELVDAESIQATSTNDAAKERPDAPHTLLILS